MDNPCFGGAVASREAEQLGNGNGNRWGGEIPGEHEEILCLFLPRASASTRTARASVASAAESWAEGTARCVPVVDWKGKPTLVF